MKRHTWSRWVLVLVLMMAAVGLVSPVSWSGAATGPVPVRVLVVTMFEDPDSPMGGEARRWLEREDLTRSIPVPGLPSRFPDVKCTPRQLCVVTTGAGEANAAASMAAIVHSGRLDLRDTYFLVAGIAGIDPERGTLGTAAWSNYVVDGSLAHEIDPRETPADWPTGYFALGADRPGLPPTWTTGSELFPLNRKLTAAAYETTRDTALADSAEAQAVRDHYPQQQAKRPPGVAVCDTVTANTFWTGSLLSRRTRDWVTLLTHDQGTYCTTQMEDNGTLTALTRGAAEGLLHGDRIAVLRAASDFDQAYPGQPAPDVLKETRGFPLAGENAYRVAAAFAHHITDDWGHWRDGIPPATP